MSNRMTPDACGSISGVQPVAASVASVSRSMISSSSPTFSAMQARNSSPFSAARQASVAIRRARVTTRLRILSRQMLKRLDGAHDRRLADAARSGDALAEADDAGERVDDAEAVAQSGAPPAAGNCWCRDRAQRRSRRLCSRGPSRRDAVWRSTTPAGAMLPRTIGVEAIGCPGLVTHRMPSCRPEASRLNGRGRNQCQIGESVTAGGSSAIHCFCNHPAMPGGLLVGLGPLLYVNATISRPQPLRARAI